MAWRMGKVKQKIRRPGENRPPACFLGWGYFIQRKPKKKIYMNQFQKFDM